MKNRLLEQFLSATVRAGLSAAAGDLGPASLVAPQVATLTEGVLKTMWLTKLKTVAALLLGLAILGGGVGVLTRGGAAQSEGPTQAIAQDSSDEAPAAPAERVPLRDLKKALEPKVEGVPDLGLTPKSHMTKAPVFGCERLERLLEELLASKRTDQEIVDALFLAALGRLPIEGENTKVAKHLAARKGRAGALREVLDTLVHSAEFQQHASKLAADADAKKNIRELRDTFDRGLPRPRDKRDPNAPGIGPYFQ
jgi:hypothetical protein